MSEWNKSQKSSFIVGNVNNVEITSVLYNT